LEGTSVYRRERLGDAPFFAATFDRRLEMAKFYRGLLKEISPRLWEVAHGR
jgi:hypothetical protein